MRILQRQSQDKKDAGSANETSNSKRRSASSMTSESTLTGIGSAPEHPEQITGHLQKAIGPKLLLHLFFSVPDQLKP